MRCYNCGFENKDGVTFCHNCGVNLKNFDDYYWPYDLPIGHNYRIVFIDNSNFEDIEL